MNAPFSIFNARIAQLKAALGINSSSANKNLDVYLQAEQAVKEEFSVETVFALEYRFEDGYLDHHCNYTLGLFRSKEHAWMAGEELAAKKGWSFVGESCQLNYDDHEVYVVTRDLFA